MNEEFIKKSDFQITSTSFGPSPVDFKGNYHYKELNPLKGKLKDVKDKVLLVRNIDGIDYLLKFLGSGKEIKPGHENYQQVKRWKYFAPYVIIERKEPAVEKKRHIPAQLRNEVIRKQSNKCLLCGESFDQENLPEVDHILEWSCGGLTTEENLQALCRIGCHWAKTIAFRKAKQKNLVNPYQWEQNKVKNYFLKEFAERVRANSGL